MSTFDKIKKNQKEMNIIVINQVLHGLVYNGQMAVTLFSKFEKFFVRKRKGFLKSKLYRETMSQTLRLLLLLFMDTQKEYINLNDVF